MFRIAIISILTFIVLSTNAQQELVIQPEVTAIVERLANDDFLIQWTLDFETVDVYVSTNPEDLNDRVHLAHVSGMNETIITGLDPQVRYYFQLVFADDTVVTVAERFLPLEGQSNFRDIGGYQTSTGQYVRWGRVYRSGELDELTADDMRYLQEHVGLRFVCDLRSDFEKELSTPLNGVEYLSLPLAGEGSEVEVEAFLLLRQILQADADAVISLIDELITASYIETIDTKADMFGIFFTHLADEEALPAMYHCTFGKDRAGLTTALLLGLLGVPDETIIADFSLSNLAVIDDLESTTSFHQLANLGLSPNAIEHLMSVNPAWMQATLDHIQQTYGSVEAYLLDKAGVDIQTLETLRFLLLTDNN